tara:strand:- start:1180 stop:1344 length:165 start_codon:yes stop_codon:yes gene_type:complete
MYQFTDKTSGFGGLGTNRYPKAISGHKNKFRGSTHKQTRRIQWLVDFLRKTLNP